MKRPFKDKFCTKAYENPGADQYSADAGSSTLPLKRHYFQVKKTIIMLPIALLIGSLFACNGIKNAANINVDIPYTTQVNVPDVPGYTTGVALPAGGVDLPSVTVGFATNSQTYMSQYGTAANMVVSVTVKSMSIQIQSPAGQNFDFLDNIQIYMSAKGQPEVLAVSENSIPKGSTILNLTPNPELNLKNYFVQDTIYMRIAGHINAVPVAGEQLNINSVFHLVANPLK